MAIREVIRDADGKPTYRTVAGYEDPKPKAAVKPPKVNQEHKETVMKSKKATPKSKPKAVNNAPKATFKTTIMALNGDNVYVKKGQQELDSDKQLIQEFTRWVNSGVTGEFFAIRRK